jgi:hypothetical protein
VPNTVAICVSSTSSTSSLFIAVFPTNCRCFARIARELPSRGRRST